MPNEANFNAIESCEYDRSIAVAERCFWAQCRVQDIDAEPGKCTLRGEVLELLNAEVEFMIP